MRSMTGFGKARGGDETRHVEVEVRSVNNRFLKLQIRVPRELSACEGDIEKLVRKRLARGAVHLSLRLRDDAVAAGVRIDSVVADRLFREATELAQHLGLSHSPSLSDILSLPGVVVSADASDDVPTELQTLALDTVGAALDALQTMRETEGSTLGRELEVIRQRIGDNLAFVETRMP
ncbi:MAG: hypothetical protein KDB53_18245, partial [Planctomycetes bacterium]|nr:hypothetical protein [Planctomycetota bacterium]